MGCRSDRIAFSRWEPGTGEWLFTMCADGGDVRQLTGPESGHSCCPSWSPDGTRLCFASRRNSYSDLYVIDADGRREMQATAAENVDDDWPAWSPDSREIAFSRSNGSDDLWLLSVDSGEVRALTSEGHMNYRPTWSPDGRSIAFRRSLVKASGVYVMPADGGRAWFLTNGRDPNWSPLGDRLAYVVDNCVLTIGLTTDGRPVGEPIRLSCESGMMDSHPCWSPDATHLAFQREEVADGPATARIMTISADGRDLRDLGEGRMPDWSPVPGDLN